MTAPRNKNANRNQLCPIGRTASLVSDAWTPLLLRDLMAGNNRFAELQASLNISKAVLTQRLRSLVEHDIVERVPYQDRPERFEYVLTEKGWALWDVLLAMWGFGDEWLFRDHAGLVLVDAATGAEVQPVVVDKLSGEPIDVRNVDLQLRTR